MKSSLFYIIENAILKYSWKWAAQPWSRAALFLKIESRCFSAQHFLTSIFHKRILVGIVPTSNNTYCLVLGAIILTSGCPATLISSDTVFWTTSGFLTSHWIAWTWKIAAQRRSKKVFQTWKIKNMNKQFKWAVIPKSELNHLLS